MKRKSENPNSKKNKSSKKISKKKIKEVKNENEKEKENTKNHSPLIFGSKISSNCKANRDHLHTALYKRSSFPEQENPVIEINTSFSDCEEAHRILRSQNCEEIENIAELEKKPDGTECVEFYADSKPTPIIKRDKGDFKNSIFNKLGAFTHVKPNSSPEIQGTKDRKAGIESREEEILERQIF